MGVKDKGVFPNDKMFDKRIFFKLDKYQQLLAIV